MIFFLTQTLLIVHSSDCNNQILDPPDLRLGDLFKFGILFQIGLSRIILLIERNFCHEL